MTSLYQVGDKVNIVHLHRTLGDYLIPPEYWGYEIEWTIDYYCGVENGQSEHKYHVNGQEGRTWHVYESMLELAGPRVKFDPDKHFKWRVIGNNCSRVYYLDKKMSTSSIIAKIGLGTADYKKEGAIVTVLGKGGLVVALNVTEVE